MNQHVSPEEVRLPALMLHSLMQAWAGVLGGGPQPGSPLHQDLQTQDQFATERLSIPFQQLWTYAQTLGQAASDHETMMRESLLRYSNDQGPCPVTSLDSMCRIALELFSMQAWLIEPQLNSSERLSRWLAVEHQTIRNQWTLLHPNQPHSDNPALVQLVNDADKLRLDRDQSPKLNWVGTPLPKATETAGDLLARYSTYAPHSDIDVDAQLGSFMYRITSGGVHGSAGHLLSGLLPFDNPLNPDHVSSAYGLSAPMLWRSVSVMFLASFSARSTYAEWLGIDVPAETRRLHHHHIDKAIDHLSRINDTTPERDVG